MKKYLQIILISLIVSAASLYVYYNHIPLEPIKLLDEQMLGASITTINATDKIKDSRTVINTNFTNLNTDKLENSDYYASTTHSVFTDIPNLDTIGTIDIGVWEATALTVAYGGTGSTTLSSNQVLLGNGAGILKTVAGFGTSGQFLTSTGAGTAPIWQTSSVALGNDYAWTGEHSFATDTSLATTTQHGVSAGLMPVGSITAYATTTAPQGWLACDGSSLATTTYADLFAVIGYSYGGSSANFNLPNLNGREIVGYGSATSTYDTMGETGGEDEHIQTIDEMPSHNHSFEYDGTQGTSGIAGTAVKEHTSTDTMTTTSTGGGTAFNVMDPFIVLQYIIKY